MKILFLPHNGKLYGANKSLLSVMLYLNKKHDILLFVPFKNQFADVMDKNNIPFKAMPYYASLLYVRINNPKYIIYPVLFFLDVVMFPFLLYKAYRFNPDIIYSNSSVENIGILIAKVLGKKHITHVREFGDLDFDFNFVGGATRKKKYLNLSTGIIFNSKIVEETVLAPPLQKAKTRVIYNGIKLAANNYTNRSLKHNDAIVFGIVGYIHTNKGQLNALLWLKKHLKTNSRIKLRIYGDGVASYINKIQQVIDNEGMADSVTLMGFSNDVEEIYNSIDMLLIFAENEAFGRVTIEAMQKGLPIIAYNGGAAMELINNGTDGLLFKTEAEFDGAIEKIINNPLLFESISKNAITKASENFTEEVYCKNIEQFIIEINSLKCA